MTISESILYYLPELLQSLKETAIMMGISMLAAIVLGLPLGVWLFLSRSRGKKISFLYECLNLIVTIIRSFPFLLFVVALIPLTRMLLGSSFGPIPASFPLSIVAMSIFARFSQWQYVWSFLLVEARSGLILSLTTTAVSMVSYSTVMGIVGGGGIGDFAIRYGYQRYEYGVMYFAIIIMILLVFILQGIGNQAARKLDKRK
jgi:D-methionine transport system permease protein